MEKLEGWMLVLSPMLPMLPCLSGSAGILLGGGKLDKTGFLSLSPFSPPENMNEVSDTPGLSYPAIGDFKFHTSF